ncbi:MAG: PAS domain S-box protein, partial [Candidatus Hydrogenedentes bacterium]|nr:PAS domain S-box protein [Candidatus Hydrogenedentota bacterium]
STSDGRVVLVNKRFLEMTGLEEEQVVGTRAVDLAKRLNVEHSVVPHLESRHRGIASEYEVTYRVNGEDRIFWFSGTPIFDRSGRHTGILATVRDVTEFHRLSRRVERYAQGLQELVEEQTEKLRLSEDRFRRLLLSMNEGFVTLDSSYRIRFANERICALLGLGQAEVLGREVFDFVDSSGRIHLLNLLAQGAALEQSEMRREMYLIDADRNAVPVVAALAYIGDAASAEAKYSIVVTSVLELKEMHHQLEERARALEKLNEELRMHDRAKDSFLSNVSHELRTPLSTIQGYIEMLESESLGALTEPQQGALKVMRRNVKRLIGHINEIIEFSRMEIRGIQLNISLFSPERLVKEAVASVHPHALAKDISLNVFVEESVDLVWADRDRMSQVLGILLNNAVKFTGAGGMIQVRVARGEANALVVSVSDTGIGIDPAYHDKVFDKFYQVDSSRTRRYEGTGIGLSIAKSLVEAHRGILDLQSALGQGSTFSIHLPDALLVSDFDPEAAEELVGRRLLLVDDRGVLKRAFHSLFIACGFQIEEARSGFECVRAAEHLQPDCILIDEGGGGVAGSSTLEPLRQHGATAAIPVVLCSGADDRANDQSPVLVGDVRVLGKPFTAGDLLECLRDAALGHGEEFHHESVAAATERINVFVVDQDPGLLEWLETGLRLRGFTCCCAPDVPRAVEQMTRQIPHIVFLDGDVPIDHLQREVAALRAGAHAPDLPVYIMSGAPKALGQASRVQGVVRKPFTIKDVTGVIERAGLSQSNASPVVPA